ncbi:unnamed protein product [Ectocarpus sp. CCAP 1310/34]|nr:unnamed protein product [Ectocarpus sp. CCAP 1310/34]
MDASWQDVLVLDGQQEGKEERARHAATLAAAAVNGDGTHAHAGVDNRVLVVEDLEADGDILGFFGALDSPTATGPTLDTYICVRTGREVDRPTTRLLTRALHGWLSGPAAAAAATGRDWLGGLAGAEAAGRPANEEEEGELVDWVDTRGRVICALPRPVVHSNNVLHRGAGVMVRDAKARTACFEEPAIMSLVEDTMKASKKEEPAGTMEGAADRGDARKSAAAESTNAEGGAPWTGSAQDGSGEAGGFVPQEVRVAAAQNQDYSSAMGDGGAAVGFGYGATTPATGYQSVRYTFPPFSGKSKYFNQWLNDFRMAANGANLLEQFEESGSLEIPVNSGKNKFLLSQQYRSEQVELTFHAWKFLSHALNEKDRKIMKWAETPQGGLRELKTIHDPESSVQPSEDLKSLTSNKISRGETPQNALNEMLQSAKSLNEKGLTVNETFVFHLFLDALWDEYAMTNHNLRHAKELTRAGVLKELMIEYKAIKDKLEQGKGKGAKGAEQAAARSGTQVGVRGKVVVVAAAVAAAAVVAAVAAAAQADPDGSRRAREAAVEAPMAADIVPWCARCEGWGHTKEKCATEEAVLAQVVEHESDVDSVEDQAFCAVAVPPGECGTVGEVGLVRVVEQGQAVYVADTAATCSMFRCADNFVNYRERSGWVKGIGGDKAPVPRLGYGHVTLVLQTEDGGVPAPVLNTAHVPEDPYNLLSLSSLAEEGHTYSGMKGGLTLTTKAWGEVWFPRTGKLLTQRGYQIKPTLHTACAALIVPGDAKAATPTDLSEYHLAHGHAHETLLWITAEQQGVQLPDGPLLPCLGCWMSKGQVTPVQKSTSTRALLPLADDEQGGEGEIRADASRQGWGGQRGSESESDLDVMEARGPGQATPFVREEAPTAPGNGIPGDGGSVPPSPPSGRGDFGGGSDSPTDSSSSSSSPSSSSSDAGGAGGSGGEESGDPCGDGGSDGDPGDSENLQELKRKVQEVLDPEQQAFGAEVDASGSSQPLPDPQLSMTSPIGQKPSDVEAVPMTYKDVMCSKYEVSWEAAVKKEIDGHDKTGTFTKVKELPEGRKAIGSTWVFSWKTNEKGLIVDF